MDLLTSTTSFVLWQDVVKHAEDRCSVTLDDELESYLISLLMRYINQPEAVKQVVATAFLHALHQTEKCQANFQRVGDQCLLFTGLFPRIAEKRQVKINYFVGIGQSAYAAISHSSNDLYSSLAMQFVVLMDVLQSIRPYSDLLPLEAYEQWNELGSQRALKMLQAYTHAMPFKSYK